MWRNLVFYNKCLMKIGGTGSFGNTDLQYLIVSDVREIRAFCQDEKASTSQTFSKQYFQTATDDRISKAAGLDAILEKKAQQIK